MLLSRLQAKADSANDAKADSHAKESAKGSVTVGSVLPDLVLKNEKGDDIVVADLAKETGVIIFAIPKADTREFLFMLNILYCTIYVDGPIFLRDCLSFFPSGPSFPSATVATPILSWLQQTGMPLQG